MRLRSGLRELGRSLAVPLKIGLLALVAFRFHGTWIGLTVVLAMAFLLFGVDRSVRRWVVRAARTSK